MPAVTTTGSLQPQTATDVRPAIMTAAKPFLLTRISPAKFGAL
jgi:hypothetical protein